MKAFFNAAIIFTLIFSGTLSFAQKPVTGCNDINIKGLSDGIKLGFSKQGLTVFQEAMLQMSSMEPVPIAVKMTKGVPYQLIFVGSENANRMTMEIYDGNDKKLDEKVERGSSNNIVYSFTPSKTDIYLITLTQKKGVKDMCGYFGVMMKAHAAVVNAPQQTKPVPATPAKNKTTNKTAPTPNKTNNYQAMPANQRPNPNRTKATNQSQQQRK